MRLFRSMTVFAGLVMSSGLLADELPCSQWGGVAESQQIYFLDPERDQAQGRASQSALIDFGGPFASSWLQAHLKGSELVLRNKMPGLGLPTTIYHVRAEWIAQLGQLVGTESFPADGVCESLSLFPGQYSPALELKRPDTNEALRLRVTVWGVGP